MPLIEISALAQRDGAKERALGAVVEEVAAALGRPPESVWVVWRELAPGSYAVGTSRPHEQPADTHPPVVRVYARRTDEEIERIVAAIERAVERELGLDVFVVVERPA